MQLGPVNPRDLVAHSFRRQAAQNTPTRPADTHGAEAETVWQVNAHPERAPEERFDVPPSGEGDGSREPSDTPPTTRIRRNAGPSRLAIDWFSSEGSLVRPGGDGLPARRGKGHRTGTPAQAPSGTVDRTAKARPQDREDPLARGVVAEEGESEGKELADQHSTRKEAIHAGLEKHRDGRPG